MDLGATAVRVVEVFSEGKGTRRLRLGERGRAPLPRGAWDNLENLPQVLGEAIQRALHEAHIATRHVAAAIPRRMVMFRMARLPHAPEEELPGMVAFEAQQQIPYPLQDVVLGYRALDGASELPDAGGLQTVLIAAARRDLVAAVLAAFEKHGLEVDLLTVSALALAELAREVSEPTAIVAMRPGELNVAVVSDGRLQFARAGALDLDPAAAEEAERAATRELIRSFNAYAQEHRDKPLSRVLTVDGTDDPGEGASFRAALTGLLDLPVGPLNGSATSGLGDAGGYAIAAGTALQAFPGNLARVDLVPGERDVERQRQGRKRRNQLLGACALVLLALAGWTVQQDLAARAAQHRDDVDANTKLDGLDQRLAARQKQLDQITALAQDVQEGLDRGRPAVDVLVAVNSSLPSSPDIWLTQLTFVRHGLLTLRGNCVSADLATQLIQNLENSRAFSDVRLSFMGDTASDQVLGAGSGAAQSPEGAKPLPGPAGPPSAGPSPPVTTPGTSGAPGSVAAPKPGPRPGGAVQAPAGQRFRGFTPGAFPGVGGFPTRRRFGGGPAAGTAGSQPATQPPGAQAGNGVPALSGTLFTGQTGRGILIQAGGDTQQATPPAAGAPQGGAPAQEAPPGRRPGGRFGGRFAGGFPGRGFPAGGFPTGGFGRGGSPAGTVVQQAGPPQPGAPVAASVGSPAAVPPGPAAGPVPPLSPPPGGIQRVGPPAGSGASGGTKRTLTAFVITCRVVDNVRKVLVKPAGAVEPRPLGSKKAGHAKAQ